LIQEELFACCGQIELMMVKSIHDRDRRILGGLAISEDRLNRDKDEAEEVEAEARIHEFTYAGSSYLFPASVAC
jgi:hypothetical protein